MVAVIEASKDLVGQEHVVFDSTCGPAMRIIVDLASGCGLTLFMLLHISSPWFHTLIWDPRSSKLNPQLLHGKTRKLQVNTFCL